MTHGRQNERRLTTEEKVSLWGAINRYAESCGGNTGAATANAARASAVVEVERVVEALLNPLTEQQLLALEVLARAGLAPKSLIRVGRKTTTHGPFGPTVESKVARALERAGLAEIFQPLGGNRRQAIVTAKGLEVVRAAQVRPNKQRSETLC